MKDKIIQGASQYSEYITTNVPQLDEEGNVKYYFSGSLAMLLLSSAQSIKPLQVDKSGKVISQQETVEITDKEKDYLAAGVRPIGIDVDIVEIDEKSFSGKCGVYNLQAVRDNCDLATVLCPSWQKNHGTMYFDTLADEREFAQYDVAQLTMEDGSIIYIADPMTLVAHKLADAIHYQKILDKFKERGETPEAIAKKQAQYDKDIKDFTSMFNCLASLYPDTDFNQLMARVLQNCPQTAFASLMSRESGDRLDRFFEDAKGHVAEDNQESFGEFMGAAKHQNQVVLEKQSAQ